MEGDKPGCNVNLPIFPPKYDFAVNQILTKRETQSRVTILTKSRVTFSQKKEIWM